MSFVVLFFYGDILKLYLCCLQTFFRRQKRWQFIFEFYDHHSDLATFGYHVGEVW